MKKKINHSQKRQGFTLLMLAVVLAVAGLLFVGLKQTSAGTVSRKYDSTATKLAVINKAIKSYYTTLGYYPCPANRALAQGSGGQYGTASCAGAYTVSPATSLRIGAVPVRTLNLPDDYMYDQWGHEFVYTIDVGLTASPASTNILVVQDTTGTTVSGATSSCGSNSLKYVIISPGPNSIGAYNKFGKMEGTCTAITTPTTGDEFDRENCDDDKYFVYDKWKTNNSLRSFDDIAINDATSVAGGSASGSGGGTGSSTPVTASLLLWLDGADNSTVLDASNAPAGDTIAVKTWKDKSTSLNHATQSTAAQQPTYEMNKLGSCRNTLKFNATNANMNLTSTTNIGGTAYTIFAVFNTIASSASTYRYVYQFNGNKHLMGLKPSSSSYGSISTAANFGTAFTAKANTQDLSGDFRIPPNEFMIGTLNANSTADKVYANGFEITQKADTAAAITYLKKIGNSTSGGTDALGGSIAEILLYSGSLSDANRKLVECYLGTKWGIFVPECVTASTTTPACPAGTSGCKMWLDASDSDTLYKFDGTKANANGEQVAAWLDKSGYQNDAVGLWNSSTRRPAFHANAVGSLGGVTFDGSNDILQTMTEVGTTAYTGTTTGVSVFAVSTCGTDGLYDSGSGYWYITRNLFWFNNDARIGMGNNSEGHNTCDMRAQPDGTYWDGFGFYGVTRRATPYISTFIPSATNSQFRYNGQDYAVRDVTHAYAIPDYNFGYMGMLGGAFIGTNGGLPPGNNVEADAQFGWHGDIMELIFYPTELSTVSRDAVECYLATKWNIFVPHCTTTNSIVGSCPAGVTGCLAWLDAADTTTLHKEDGSLAADGEAVAVWQDKSGNKKDAAALFRSSNWAPIYHSNVQNSKGGVYFVGGASGVYTGLSDTIRFSTSNFTTISVYNYQFGDFDKTIWSAYGSAEWLSWVNPITTVDWNNLTYYSAALPPNNYHITATVGRSSASAFYMDGKDITETPAATDASAIGNAIITIGAGRDFISPLNGNLLEMLVYNTDLTAANRKKVECYLANKWSVLGCLVGYWKFNEGSGTSATDNSGMGNTGTLAASYVTGASNVPSIFASSTYSLSFNGTTHHATLPIDLSSYNKITVSFWMKKTFANDGKGAIEYTNDNGTVAGAFLIDPNATNTKFQISISGTNASFTRPSSAAWHHYAFVLDRSSNPDSITAYVDGTAQTLTYGAQVDTSVNFANSSVYLMGRTSGTTLLGAGILDDFRIYGNGVAATDITAIKTGNY